MNTGGSNGSSNSLNWYDERGRTMGLLWYSKIIIIIPMKVRGFRKKCKFFNFIFFYICGNIDGAAAEDVSQDAGIYWFSIWFKDVDIVEEEHLLLLLSKKRRMLP